MRRETGATPQDREKAERTSSVPAGLIIAFLAPVFASVLGTA